MRDIRLDLQERIDAIRTERDRLQRRIDGLADQEQGIKSLLEDEESRWSQSSLPLAIEAQPPQQNPVRVFLLSVLADGQPHTVDQLKKMAVSQGIPAESAGGRTIHLTLVNLARHGQARQLGGGTWQMAGKEAVMK